MSDPADVGGAFVTLYEQLRAVARAKLAGSERVSLQATALVHEALLRLSGRPMESFNDEHHMLAAAAQAIRHVIVDHMRAKLSAKRDGRRTKTLSDLSPDVEAMLDQCGPERADLAIDLDHALNELADIDPEMRVIVELHVFGGLPLIEIAALTDNSERTVRRRWQFAAAVLRQKLDAWNLDGREEPN